MRNEYSKAIYFGLGYSALGSLAYLLMRFGIHLDVTMYPYQKPLMLVVAAIAFIAGVILLVLDIRRKSECGLGMRLIVVLAVVMLTFEPLMQIWGFLMLYIGGF